MRMMFGLLVDWSVIDLPLSVVGRRGGKRGEILCIVPYLFPNWLLTAPKNYAILVHTRPLNQFLFVWFTRKLIIVSAIYRNISVTQHDDHLLCSSAKSSSGSHRMYWCGTEHAHWLFVRTVAKEAAPVTAALTLTLVRTRKSPHFFCFCISVEHFWTESLLAKNQWKTISRIMQLKFASEKLRVL